MAADIIPLRNILDRHVRHFDLLLAVVLFGVEIMYHHMGVVVVRVGQHGGLGICKINAADLVVLLQLAVCDLLRKHHHQRQLVHARAVAPHVAVIIPCLVGAGVGVAEAEAVVRDAALVEKVLYQLLQLVGIQHAVLHSLGSDNDLVHLLLRHGIRRGGALLRRWCLLRSGGRLNGGFGFRRRGGDRSRINRRFAAVLPVGKRRAGQRYDQRRAQQYRKKSAYLLSHVLSLIFQISVISPRWAKLLPKNSRAAAARYSVSFAPAVSYAECIAS